MRTRSVLLLLATALAVASCSDTSDDLIAPVDVELRTVATSGGDAFSFLPPVARGPAPRGAFDATLLPYLSVEICQVEGEDCPVVAALDAAASGPERLRLDDDGGAYLVVWSTRGLKPGSYRLTVRAVTLELATLDIALVARGRDLRGVPSGVLGVVRNRRVPIRFWVPEGAAEVVGPSGGTVTALDGRVTLDIPEGALPEPFAMAIEPTDPEDPDAVLAFELAPWDAGFLEPVTLSVLNHPLPIPQDPSASEEYILEHDDADGAWHEVPSVYDFETGEVRIELTTFALDPVEQPEAPALPEDEPVGAGLALDAADGQGAPASTADPEIGAFSSSFLPRPTIPRIRLPRFRIPTPVRTVTRLCTEGLRLNPSTVSVAIGGEVSVNLEAARISSTGPFGLPGYRWYQVSASGAAWSTTSSLIDVEPGRVLGQAAGTGHYRVRYPSPERTYCRSSYTLGSVEVAAPETDAITLSATELTLEVGETAPLSATLTAADGTDVTGLRPVAFASDDPSVATVDADGVITAVAPGDATLTITSDGATANATVTVAPIPVTSVTISPDAGTIEEGESITFTAALAAADGSALSRDVSWSATPASGVSLAASGSTLDVTGDAAGDYTITATSDGISSSVNLTVEALAPPPPGSSTAWSDGEFDPANWSYTLVTAGNGGTVDVTVESGGDPGRHLKIAQHFAAGTTSDPSFILTFHARNQAVHDPAADGAIESLDYSESAILYTCEFTACDGQQTGPAVMQDGNIYVRSVGSTSYAEFKDAWGTLSASGLSADDFRQVMDARNPGVQYLGPDKPDFSAHGSPLQFGFYRWGSHTNSLRPTRTAGIDNWTVTLHVAPPPAPVSTVSVTPSSATVATGEVQSFTVETRDADGNLLVRDIHWSLTPGTGAASLTADGATADVTGDAAGEVTVTATSEGVSGSATLTIQDGTPTIAEVTMDAPATELEAGQTLQLTATVTDTDGNDITGDVTVQWVSASPSVATVDATGLVSGVAAGTAEITAGATNDVSSGSSSAQLTVTEPATRPTAEGAIPATAAVPFYGYHDVAVADDGTGYAIWCVSGTLAVARTLNGSTWELMGSTDVGSCGSDAQSHAGVDAQGTLYMVQPTGLYTSTDGGTTLTGPAVVPASPAAMAVRADGAVFIATTPSSSRVEIHRSDNGGPLSLAQTIHTPYSDQQIGEPDLAVDAQGTLHMVWKRTNSVGHFHDYLRSTDGVSWTTPSSFTNPSWSHRAAEIAADPNGNLIVVFATFNSGTSQSEQWTYTSTSGGSSWAQHHWSTQAFITDQAPLAAGRTAQYFTTSAFDGHYGRTELYVHEWAGSWAQNIAFASGVAEADLDANANGRLCVVQDDGVAWCETR
jgi:uncharacterized protein YjdB